MISVIVPVHNVEAFLPRCLDSIVNSTYLNIEVILIENGSTDDSLKICTQYEKKYGFIRCFSSEKSGVSMARNLGIKHSKGEYITFVDADDYISPYMFECMIKAIESSDSDMVICGLIMGCDEKYGFGSHNGSLSILTITINDFLYGFFVKERQDFLSVYCKLFKTEAVKNVSFDEKISFAEDQKYIINVLYNINSISVINDGLYYYYRGNTNSLCSQNSVTLRMDGFKACLEFQSAIDYYFHNDLYREYTWIFILRRSVLQRKENQRIFHTNEYDSYLKEIEKKAKKNVWRAHKIRFSDKVSILMEYYFPNLKAKLSGMTKKL